MILTDIKKHLIKRKIIDGTFKTAVEVYRSLELEGYKLDVKTITRALNSIGFKSSFKKKNHL